MFTLFSVLPTKQLVRIISATRLFIMASFETFVPSLQTSRMAAVFAAVTVLGSVNNCLVETLYCIEAKKAHLHKLKAVEGATETCFGIGYDGCVPVPLCLVVVGLHAFDL